MPVPERRLELVALAALLLIAAAAGLPAIRAPFTFDEIAGIAANRAIRPGSPVSAAIAYRFSPDQARPLFFLSLLADARLFGTNPLPFRITNLLLHLIGGALFYLLLRRLAGGPAALAGVAFFLLHPLQSESVLYTWGRSGVMAAGLSWLALLVAPGPGGPRADPGREGAGATRAAGCLAWTAAMGCLVLALLAKEEAAALPLIALIWWRLGERRPAGRSVRAAALLAMPVALFLLGRLLLLGAAGRQVFARSLADNILGQSIVTLRMARLILLPIGQSVDHAAEVPALLPGLAASLLCLALVAGAIALRNGPFRLVAAGLLIAAAGCLLYWLVPLPDLMSERRAYLAIAGASLALAGLVERFGARAAERDNLRRVGGGAARPAAARLLLPAAIVAAIMTPLLLERARVWAEPARLWQEAAALAPGKARPLINLGVLAAERGDIERAGHLFEQAVAAEPRNPEALFNRARLRLDRGETLGAERDLEAATDAGPRLTIAWINLGLARLRLGKRAAAAEALRRALAIDPDEPRALTNLGEILRSDGRVEEALALYRRALRSDPSYSYAAARLGVALEARGDRSGALEAYREALRRGATNDADREALREKVRSLEMPAALPAPAPPVR